MPSATKTPPAPLFTADNVELKIGDLVWGVDTNCRHSAMPIIEPLLVVSFDLGTRREVRLRRERGTEWTWSANAKSDTCNTADQFIYANYESAQQAIATVTEPLRQEHADRLENEMSSLKDLDDDYRESLKRAQEDVDKARKVLEDFDKQVTKLTTGKAPKNPFTLPSLPETRAAVKKTPRKRTIARKRRK